MKSFGITIYGCTHDEMDAFRTISKRFGVMATIINAPVSETNAISGNQCISVGHNATISEAILRALAHAGVKYISTRSVGYDHIDAHAARKMGIAVCNVAYSPDSVADYTLMLMLMAVRNAKATVCAVGRNDYSLHNTRSKALRDMTIGVLGTGHIGKAVIARLQGFGCRILAYGKTQDTAGKHVMLAELLRQSDVLTLHLPLNEQTEHIIGYEQIKAMKPGALIVNTGRGSLIDTGALIQALETGKLGGAALDVLEGEEGYFYFDYTQKPIDHQFLLQLQRMPNVIVTPHTAYYTERTLLDTVEKTIINCLEFERGLLYG